jgi:hypothetical protein
MTQPRPLLLVSLTGQYESEVIGEARCFACLYPVLSPQKIYSFYMVRFNHYAEPRINLLVGEIVTDKVFLTSS